MMKCLFKHFEILNHFSRAVKMQNFLSRYLVVRLSFERKFIFTPSFFQVLTFVRGAKFDTRSFPFSNSRVRFTHRQFKAAAS